VLRHHILQQTEALINLRECSNVIVRSRQHN